MVSPQVEEKTPEPLKDGWREYELVGVFRPDLSPEASEAILKNLTQVIEENGRLVALESWGKKKLAYPIMHFVEGVYFLVRFQSSPSLIRRLEARLRSPEEFLRHLIVEIK